MQAVKKPLTQPGGRLREDAAQAVCTPSGGRRGRVRGPPAGAGSVLAAAERQTGSTVVLELSGSRRAAACCTVRRWRSGVSKGSKCSSGFAVSRMRHGSRCVSPARTVSSGRPPTSRPRGPVGCHRRARRKYYSFMTRPTSRILENSPLATSSVPSRSVWNFAASGRVARAETKAARQSPRRLTQLTKSS